MKKIILIICLAIANCLLLTAYSFSQTLSPKVIPASGGYFTGGGISLSWTMGEPLYKILQSGNIILTQGEQQPYIKCLLTVNAGQDESTFFGYSGDQQVTRTAIVSGGTAPYTYSWTIGRPLLCNVITSSGDEIFSGGVCSNTVCPTNGSLTGIASCSGSATITVRLVDTTNVCVTVTDANNCIATDCFLVMAEDVRCFAGNSNNSKVKVCHHTGSTSNPWVQLCIADNAVSAHLAHNSGDYVGSCVTNFSYLGDLSIYESSKPGFNIYPNPGNGDFIVSLNLADADVKGGIIQIININGQIIKRININEQHKLNISLKESGVYFIRLLTNKQILTKKLAVLH